MVPALRLYWRDNNNKRGQQSFWLPEGLTIAAYLARANALRDAAMALSSAHLESGELIFENVLTLPGGIAAPESDIRTNLVLFFKDETGSIGSWRVPSPGNLPYDLTGEWRGIRIQPDAMAAAGLLDLVQDAAALTVFPWQDPFPSVFTIAGIDVVIP